ncbi:MAG TPA: glycosyltransferase family 2 protein [Thermomicrobiales bacterium]|nr:glycosyltransferase family 2 protein [Thermomicrobiales bacterium]
MMSVTVAIVNYNGGTTILTCLRALTDQLDPKDIVIVDNASTDGSTRLIHATFPQIRILPLRRNVGFARAVNIAASRINHDGALVTLNPDTMPSPSFIAALVQPLVDDPRLGSTAGTLVFTSNPEIVASAGIRVYRNGVALDDRLGEAVGVATGAVRPVFGASGGAAAYRLSALRDVRGFCEAFFLYLEDVDLAWRLQLRGWESANVPNAIASHDYSSSSVEGSSFKRKLLARNRIWTLARCLPREIWFRDRASIIAFDLLAAGYGTLTRDGASLQGRSAAIAGLPMRLRERSRIQSSASVQTEMIDKWVEPAISPHQLLELRRLTASLAQPVRG